MIVWAAGITVIYGASGGGASADGAAILIDSAGPVISNCIFASGVVSYLILGFLSGRASLKLV